MRADSTCGRLPVGAAELAWFRDGRGPKVVLVHGSWDDHHSWDRIVRRLTDAADVIRYDRRGHSASTAPPGQGRLTEDAADLLELVRRIAGEPVHLVGHSYGATVTLLAASTAPDLVAGVLVHEPPLFGLLAGPAPSLREQLAESMRLAAGLVEQGAVEAGARLFVNEVGFGPNCWEDLFDEGQRRTMLANAGTWLDQYHDPDRLSLELETVAACGWPLTVTTGVDGLPAYGIAMAALVRQVPRTRLRMLPGGHAPHLQSPDEFAAAVRIDLLGLPG